MAGTPEAGTPGAGIRGTGTEGSAPLISLDEMLLRVSKLTDRELTAARLYDLIAAMDVDDEFIGQHINFSPDAYARNLILRTMKFEMLAMCWRPGQYTSIHNHNRSCGIVRVYEGVLSEIIYRRTDDGQGPGMAAIEESSRRSADAGKITGIEAGGIHQLGNAEDSGSDLITLHFYAPPLDEIDVFLPDEQRVIRTKLHYRLESVNAPVAVGDVGFSI